MFSLPFPSKKEEEHKNSYDFHFPHFLPLEIDVFTQTIFSLNVGSKTNNYLLTYPLGGGLPLHFSYYFLALQLPFLSPPFCVCKFVTFFLSAESLFFACLLFVSETMHLTSPSHKKPPSSLSLSLSSFSSFSPPPFLPHCSEGGGRGGGLYHQGGEEGKEEEEEEERAVVFSYTARSNVGN